MAKKSILMFESRRDHYKADATVVWCFDDRFTLALQVYAEKMGWNWFDLIKVAGGAKELCSEITTPSSDYLLDQIGKSIKLHHSPEVVLMNHYNCGAYGRAATEANDEEDVFFAAELTHGKKRVEEYLRQNNLNTNVRCLLVDFKEIFEVN